MQVVVQYFEGTRYIGAQTCERQWRGGDEIVASRYWPNTAYWCQDCGEIWARSITQSEWPLPQSWGLIHSRCPRHGAGLLLLWTDLEGADHELLTRELLATIEGVSNDHSKHYFRANP